LTTSFNNESPDSLKTHKIQHIRGRAIDLGSPRVMGILNCTPDSFSDGGKFLAVDKALAQIGRMIADGATFIDIGGESTRPGSDPVPLEEELQRVIPIIEEAVFQFPNTLFSVDTTKYEVAEAALQRGVHYVNDISGLRFEPRLAELCARYDAGLILMHSIGNPKTMQQQPAYHDVVHEVLDFLLNAASKATATGVTGIILDPGIGFGKTLDHNLALLRATQTFADTGYPILIGASRKSMISTILGERPPAQRLAGTLSLHYHAMMHGATMLRVHDVQEASDSVAIYNALHNHSD